MVFEYIEMLRRKGPQLSIYEEIKIIEDNEFRWKEQVSVVINYLHVICLCVRSI